MNVRQRFEAKFVRRKWNQCWLWTACIKHGYGWFNFEGERQNAQRVSWQLYVGPIPRGLYVLHKCDTKPCVNPKHLFLGTHADNTADRIQKGRSAKGESCNRSTLTENDVRAIRKDPRSLRLIAAAYGISKSNAAQIRQCKIWKHVK